MAISLKVGMILVGFAVATIGLVSCKSLDGMKRGRMEGAFQISMDAELGEPYYFYKPEDEWCEVHVCKRIDDHAVEYTEKYDKSGKCLIAWTVDSTTNGEYTHPNGMLFDIAGKKVSWRYVSHPETCKLKAIYWGPW